MSKSVIVKSLLAAGALLAVQAGLSEVLAEKATVIELTQTGCQFLESEKGLDNAKTGADRLANSKVLELKPGKYIFRVTNKNVPYGLGFWLRGEGFGRITLPSVSGGGLNPGVTKDYVIDLKAGDYLYSCPLNPTPDYKLVVTG